MDIPNLIFINIYRDRKRTLQYFFRSYEKYIRK